MPFLVGYILGILICIPVGPINLWVINTKLRKNALSALSLALGGAFMDFCYFFTVLAGLSFLQFSQEVIFYFNIFGILLVIFLGIKEFFFHKKIKLLTPEQLKKSKSPHMLFGMFTFGAILYLSNPTLIITMSALGTFVKGLNFFPLNFTNNLSASLGLFLGACSWFALLIKIVDKYEDRIKGKFLKVFAKVSGALMIILGIVMAVRFFIQEF